MFNLSIFILLGFISLLLLLLAVTVHGSSCDDALAECDAFKPVCASFNGEHQFFYSQCDMARENCYAGKNWKPDHFNHCNVLFST